MSQLEEAAAREFTEVTETADRESVSELLVITPSAQLPESIELPEPSSPVVVFLDSPRQIIDNPEPENSEPAEKRARSASPSGSSTAEAALRGNMPVGVTEGSQKRPAIVDKHVTIQQPTTNHSDSEYGHISGGESEQGVGSTLTDALHPGARRTPPDTSEQDSDDTAIQPPVGPRPLSLGGRSSALIKECFAQNGSFRLPPGNPAVVFTGGQINNVLRVVADETARASYDMLETLIYRAIQLSLTTEPVGKATNRKGSARRGSSVVTSWGRDLDSSSGGCSDTSGALRSDDGFASIGCSYEHSDPEVIAEPPLVSSKPGCSRIDLESPVGSLNADCPVAQTLAALRDEAIQDRQQRSRDPKERFVPAQGKGSSKRRKISRTSKVMKEAYFKGMEWTRIFVSGPIDPNWNKHKFFCQICKANISIHWKGVREILRHHASEKHLRRDQHWRYEYLYKIDPYTKARIPQVS